MALDEEASYLSFTYLAVLASCSVSFYLSNPGWLVDSNNNNSNGAINSQL
jgi:hypothetical protein